MERKRGTKKRYMFPELALGEETGHIKEIYVPEVGVWKGNGEHKRDICVRS